MGRKRPSRQPAACVRKGRPELAWFESEGHGCPAGTVSSGRDRRDRLLLPRLIGATKTDSQKPEIWRWLQGNRIVLSTVEWFEDKETGRTLRRPAFDRLQKAIFAGSVKTVVVWKLDRISRPPARRREPVGRPVRAWGPGGGR